VRTRRAYVIVGAGPAAPAQPLPPTRQPTPDRHGTPAGNRGVAGRHRSDTGTSLRDLLAAVRSPRRHVARHANPRTASAARPADHRPADRIPADRIPADRARAGHALGGRLAGRVRAGRELAGRRLAARGPRRRSLVCRGTGLLVVLGAVLVSGWYAGSGASAFAQMFQP
jgi:hypothetical protein